MLRPPRLPFRAAALALPWLLLAGAAAVAGEPADEPAQASPAAAAPASPLLAPDTPLVELLVGLGVPRPAHWIEGTPELVASGEKLVREGRALRPDGRPGPRQSGAYVCTDCHNLVREDPVLSAPDPAARLTWAVEHDLPFLPGTTLWGAVDRVSWFNDDYDKKYGTLVQPALGDLRNAVQLCSAECSQGRMLKDWELDAVMAYLWSIGLDVSDLGLSEADRAVVGAGLADGGGRGAALALVRGRYLLASPAHSTAPPQDRAAGYGHGGDAARGGEIYRRSCLTCHEQGGPGSYRLSDGKASAKELLGNRARYDALSLYQAVRYGTRPFSVPIAYMPFFTVDRLSDQQMDDLTAWLEQEAAR